jgi:phosphatidylglycerol---prolipoprotein diacylglyceryl transferase
LLPYPAIDPIAFRLGPVAVRWYGLAYLVGFLCAYLILKRASRRALLPIEPRGVGDLLSALVAGVVVGARLGYVLFYNLPYFAAHPLRIFALWEGGMSFHGGLLGVVVAAWLFARSRRVPFFSVTDAVALAAPPGLFFGRLSNFINGELFGRPSELPWAMVFPAGGPVPRHPSQLYEAVLEGPLLWAILFLVARLRPGRTGALSAAFLTGYGLLRFLVEFTREPDPQLGLLLGVATMGQLLSVVAVVAGLLLWRSSTNRPAPARTPSRKDMTG